MTENLNPTLPSTPTAEVPAPAPRRKGGRPKGSKNKKPPAPKKSIKKKVKQTARKKAAVVRPQSLTQLRNRAFINEVSAPLLSVFRDGRFTNFADFHAAFTAAFPTYKMGQSLFKSICRSTGIRMTHMLMGPTPEAAPFPSVTTSQAPRSTEDDASEDDEELGGVDGTRHLVEV